MYRLKHVSTEFTEMIILIIIINIFIICQSNNEKIDLFELKPAYIAIYQLFRLLRRT